MISKEGEKVKKVSDLTERERYHLEMNIAPLLQMKTVSYTHYSNTFEMKLVPESKEILISITKEN